ncbi:MAG: dihydroxy-acid dehydratase [Planctomycetaceae bacterium]
MWYDVRPSQIMTDDAFHNAITLMAMGGSTNAIVHLDGHWPAGSLWCR